MTAPLRTSVVTAAGAVAVIDLATLKDDLGITDASTDDFLTRAIARVSALVATFCGQSFASDQVTDTFDLPGTEPFGELPSEISTLDLAAFPVTAIASVTEAGVALDTSLYALDAGAGLLTRLRPDGEPCPWGSPVLVSYTAGTVPAQVVDAVSRLVAQRYFARGRDPNLRSESLPGVGSQTWAGGGASSGMGASGLPLDIEAMLADIRVPVFA